MNRRAFTLVELLTVIAILAVLAALFFPVIKSAKGAVQQSVAARALAGVQLCATMYTADHDDAYPPALYLAGPTTQTWFGTVDASGTDPKRGLLAPYLKAIPPGDPSFEALPYLGDGSGFGYNYGAIGGDVYVRRSWAGWPNASQPARANELGDPSAVITFATSALYSVPWVAGGDGQKYEFGFFDPPEAWNGNPNVDFRHLERPVVDEAGQAVHHKGNAILAMADGHTKSAKMSELDPWAFTRFGREP